MEVRLKNLRDAAGKDLHSIGKYKPYRKFSKRNHLIMERLFNDLVDGKVDYISHKSESSFKCICRSTRGYKAQLSVGFYRDGVLIPEYHINLDSYADLRYEGYPDGIWEYGKVA